MLTAWTSMPISSIFCRRSGPNGTSILKSLTPWQLSAGRRGPIDGAFQRRALEKIGHSRHIHVTMHVYGFHAAPGNHYRRVLRALAWLLRLRPNHHCGATKKAPADAPAKVFRKFLRLGISSSWFESLDDFWHARGLAQATV